MRERDDGTHTAEGRKTLWGFLIVGLLTLLAGIFVRIPGMAVSLPKAEIVTGGVLVIGSVAALFITS